MARRRKRSLSEQSKSRGPADSGVAPKPPPAAPAAPAATDQGIKDAQAPFPQREAPRRRSVARILLEIAVPTVLLSILFLQLFFGARKKSATLDEQNHIARGLAFLRTGDPRLSLIHPPLINLICALPLVRDSKVNLPLDDTSWRTSDFNAFGIQLVWVRNANGPSIVARARVPIMVLTVVLGAAVFLWSLELSGWAPAVLSLALLCFDPNILAHGALATNDLGMACFSCLSLFTFWRLLAKPSWFRACIAGAALGLALTAKFSSIFLLVALPAMALLDWVLSPPQERKLERLKRLGLLSGAVVSAALLTVWAVYGFQIHYDAIRGFPIPAKTYFDGLQFAKARISGGGPEFLLGAYSQQGWWYYFPVAFLVKTPIPTMLLVGGAIAMALTRREWRRSAILLTPVIIYFGLAMNSPLEIGYRHLLPALPVLFVFAGQIAVRRSGRSGWRGWAARATMAALVAWLAVEAVRIYPDYLTYFNEAAGGAHGGSRVLADSNLDWGQDLPGLREYMNHQNLDSIKLSYFGSARPEAYGITNFDPLPSYPYNYHGAESRVPELPHPPPGVYAISMTNLQGVFFKDHNLYGWFRSREPDAVIGHSICVYYVK